MMFFWWITALMTGLESRALLWERHSERSAVTESLNFKKLCSSSFYTTPHLHNTLFIHVFFYCLSLSDRLVQARPQTPTMLCLYSVLIRTSSFAEMKFDGSQFLLHFLILNTKQEEGFWIMISQQQQLRRYWFKMDADDFLSIISNLWSEKPS